MRFDMRFTTRDATDLDQVHVRDCDLKCFDHVWSSDVWSFVFDNHMLRLATVDDTPVGFATYYYRPQFNDVWIPKIGVKEDFRRRGIGTILLQEAVQFGLESPATQLATNLPENMVTPGSVRDCSGWMKATGWRATDIEREMYHYLGQREDGVQFSLPLRRKSCK